jgi:hypothetical protein
MCVHSSTTANSTTITITTITTITPTITTITTITTIIVFRVKSHEGRVFNIRRCCPPRHH